jgi:Gram-negative porin
MFGGVGKSAGWATILGTVGFVLSGSVSAKAADLGGDCCADLEERVAELEATTARKGNRKVSLTVSGWVNEQVLYWNDGTENNVYVGNNDMERSRFRFVGEAKIDKDWSAGYVIELGVRDTKSSSYSQNDYEGGAVGTTVGILDVRKSAWLLKSKTYGKFEVGREGSATYHLLDDGDFTNTRLFADAESIPTIGVMASFCA